MSEPQFDETYYLAANSDVAAAVARGEYANGYEHWLQFGAAEGRSAIAPLPDLLSSPATDLLFLELTSRCNLRCVYCAVSQPTYRGIDLPLEGFDNFLEQMKARGVQLVTMNGHGESSIVKDWDVYADRLADAGFRLHVTTNLAKRLKHSEIAALSRHELILVSVDTIDPELMSQLRRGANLATILENLEAIRKYASERQRPLQIAISVTVGDLSVPGIGALVDAMLARGVRVFRFGDLSEYAAIPDTLRMRHVSTMPPEALAVAGRVFRDALAAIEAAGATAQVDAPLVSILVDDHAPVQTLERETKQGEKTVRFDEMAASQTRDCTDPWRVAFVQADASVRPCCFFEEKLGTLAENTLEEIVEGESFRRLRNEIVSGELRPNCRSCSARPLIARDAFRAKLAQWIVER
ncbi:MAG: radical SAM protein [Thermoanaerobaculia bacterium]